MPNSPATAVATHGLSKTYGDTVAVDDVSFSVAEGEIFAILGPNGAGKSTTVEMIAGLRTPDEGSVSVFGLDPLDDRTQLHEILGVQLQESRFHDRAKVGEIVETFAALYLDPADPAELLDRLGLAAKTDSWYSKLSGGQQQRLSIAVALVGQPQVVILDELTTGLDPGARRETWALVEELRESGVTVLLVTHFMDEAERLADRLAIIDQGRILAVDTPQGLIDRAGLDNQVRFSFDQSLGHDWLLTLPEVSTVARDNGEVLVTGDKGLQFAIATSLAQRGIAPDNFVAKQATLDDAFVALTGRHLTTADHLATGDHQTTGDHLATGELS